MSYYAFKNDEGESFGSFEVFYNDGRAVDTDKLTARDATPGWYWWACFPGCIPDGDAFGPFETEKEAIDDAQEA